MGDGLQLAPVQAHGNRASQRENSTSAEDHERGARKFGPKWPELTIIVPTRNERDNVAPLVARLEQAMAGIRTEVIFVDDSDDDTPAAVAGVAKRSGCRVRLIHREPQERTGGLGGAVVAGLSEARAPYACVMDGDLQHPPELVPKLLRKAASDNADIVVASRYCKDGSATSFGAARAFVSKGSSSLARILFPRRLRRVSDPMSGFFLVRLSAIEPQELKPRGFKILLDILVRNRSARVSEVAFTFGERLAGESKASFREGMLFLSLLLALRMGDTSTKFVRFGAVGISGLAVNMTALAVLTDVVGLFYLTSAILATQISSLWNFVLSERWVFDASERRRSRRVRLLLFLAMNNAALLLRGPLLILLVSLLGMNYLVANFISLVGLTALRFVIADAWIWAKDKSASPIRTYAYELHGIVTIESDVALPELARFRVDRAPLRPSIRVRIGKLSRAQSDLVRALAFLTRHIRFDDRLGRFGFGVDISIGKTTQVVASPLLRHSPHVLYTNVVEPILRWTFAKKGYALIHAAAVAKGDRAFLVTARTDTGKTTTILRLLDSGSFSFLSDDMTLLGPDGRVLAYPKPLTISRHTVHAVQNALLTRRERLALVLQSRLHSRSGRQFAMFLTRSKLPVATINAIVQLLVPPPKYHVDRLVPDVDCRQSAQLSGLFVIERGGEVSTPLSADDALETLMTNCEDAYGFPPYQHIAAFLYSRNGTDLRNVERSIVTQALTTIPAILLRSNGMDWAPRMLGALNGNSVSDDAEGLVGTPAAMPAPGIL